MRFRTALAACSLAAAVTAAGFIPVAAADGNPHHNNQLISGSSTFAETGNTMIRNENNFGQRSDSE
ncbi:hypothetical protein ABZY02_27095 [Streptomyces sp. NPDC006649]|uniref:hypothetical protein n=1 Tax=Streptomyces sp. NPDC006649 TaxID=3156896 RepID=UPI0033BAB778